MAGDDHAIQVQASPIEGFQLHRDAVAACCHGEKPGYVPPADNSANSQVLDQGETPGAIISRLKVNGDPQERIRIAVVRTREF